MMCAVAGGELPGLPGRDLSGGGASVSWHKWLPGAVAALLLALATGAGAQTVSNVPRVELVVTDSEVRARPIVDAFRGGMRELGYVEGESYVLRVQFAQGQVERIPQLVLAALERHPDVLVPGNFVAASAAKDATRTVPIAGFSCGLETLVASLARPGGNLTGVTCQSVELAAKQLQLLREALPSLRRLAVLSDPASPYRHLTLRELRAAAEQMGVQVVEVALQHPSEFGDTVARIRRSEAQAVFIAPDTQLFALRRELMRVLLAERLPTMGFFREFADDGALMSYSANRIERYHRLAWYVDRILKGTRPADLPIDQPTQFELAINQRTARDLGIALPTTLLLRANFVID